MYGARIWNHQYHIMCNHLLQSFYELEFYEALACLKMSWNIRRDDLQASKCKPLKNRLVVTFVIKFNPIKVVS